MPKRWTDKEVLLARRIVDQGSTEFLLYQDGDKPANELPTREDIEELRDMLLNAPLIPPDPPWWTQAVMWADTHQVWVKGYGWMQEDLWEDILDWKP